MENFFATQEFDCHDGTPYPPDWVDSRLAVLLRVLNPGRQKWKGPWRVVSGFRTEDWNRRVGGAPHSQHLKGLAADVQPLIRARRPSDLASAVADVHDLILEMLTAGDLPELGGLGYYPGKWVHLDVRPRGPGGTVDMWLGSGVGSEKAPTPPLPSPPDAGGTE